MVVCESVPTERIGIEKIARGEHAFGEEFKVDLMNNADAGRDDL